MEPTKYLVICCLVFIAAQSYAAHISKNYERSRFYNPFSYQHEVYEEQNPNQEIAELTFLRRRNSYIPIWGSKLPLFIQADIPLEQYILDESMESDAQKLENSDGNKNDKYAILVATDSKGQKYLLKKIVVKLKGKQTNGCINSRATIDFSLSEDSNKNIDSRDDDDDDVELFVVAKDENDDHDRT